MEQYKKMVYNADLLVYNQKCNYSILLNSSYTIIEFIKKYLNSKLQIMDIKHICGLSEISDVSGVDYITDCDDDLDKNKDNKDDSDKKSESQDSFDTKYLYNSLDNYLFPLMAQIIKNNSDLPLNWTLWNNSNVTYTDYVPFIRDRPILIHNCYNNFDDKIKAEINALELLIIYKHLYETLFSVFVYTGYTAIRNKPIYANQAYIVEAFIPSLGKVVNCASVLYLGTNLSEKHNIRYDDTKFIYQVMSEFTSASLGISVLTHHDNKGIIFSPMIAPYQIVLICNIDKYTDISDMETYINSLFDLLIIWHIHIDNKDTDITIQDRIKYWTEKGTPIIMTVNKYNIDDKTVDVIRRDTCVTMTVNTDNLIIFIKELVQMLCTNMFNVSKKKTLANSINIYSLDELLKHKTQSKNIYLAKVCKTEICEEKVDSFGYGSVLCRPFIEELYNYEITKISSCISCGCELGINICIIGHRL